MVIAGAVIAGVLIGAATVVALAAVVVGGQADDRAEQMRAERQPGDVYTYPEKRYDGPGCVR